VKAGAGDANLGAVGSACRAGRFCAAVAGARVRRAGIAREGPAGVAGAALRQTVRSACRAGRRIAIGAVARIGGVSATVGEAAGAGVVVVGTFVRAGGDGTGGGATTTRTVLADGSAGGTSGTGGAREVVAAAAGGTLVQIGTLPSL
jgi:hypothetical protein